MITGKEEMSEWLKRVRWEGEEEIERKNRKK